MKKLVIDLDGTLCSQEDRYTYHLATPKQDVIDKVNELFNAGWYVTIFTARGMNTFHGRELMAEEAWRDITEDWLEKHGVKYHILQFGKPAADLYIDDKGLSPHEFASGRF